MMESERLYRLSVGIVVFNNIGKVWLGKRIFYNTPVEYQSDQAWQFPQGGVDEGEDLEVAVRRELYEETFIQDIKILDRITEPVIYDFPASMRFSSITKKFRGQKQYWFAALFQGDDSKIKLDALAEKHRPEFSEWRWEDFAKAVDLIVDFKKAVYCKVYEAFKHNITEITSGKKHGNII